MRNAAAILAVLALAACAGGGKTQDAATSTATSVPVAVAAVTPMSASEDMSSFGGTNLPAGRELSDLQTSCQICHSSDMWYTQRLSKPIWDAEVTKMMKFGSPLPKSDKAAVVAYLAKYLGPTVPRRAGPPTATAPPLSYAGPPAAQ